MRGKIIKGIGGFYYVYVDEEECGASSGSVFECKAKGSFRNLGKKPDEDKPGLTHIVSETTNIVERPMPTPIRDYMAGNRKQEPWTRGTDSPLRQPTASELAGEPPRGAWE